MIPLAAGILGVFLILFVLLDAFETVVLPRSVNRRIRITRLFYQLSWSPWRAASRLIRQSATRDSYLGFYGPLSLLLLLGVWGITLIIGFAFVQWAAGSQFSTSGSADSLPTLDTLLYVSGTTFLTLGLGDVVPVSGIARLITVIEVGTGFGFLALVIGYVPVTYQGFSRREVHVSLLDERAGSPPTAGELLRRHVVGGRAGDLEPLLREWEIWSAELLESHLSYPALAYYRSQHENQSWVGALTVILDTCALLLVTAEGGLARQAQFTFAMARHAAGDLSQVINSAPFPPEEDRLPPADHKALVATMKQASLFPLEVGTAQERLSELRALYEPYVHSMAHRLLMRLPTWVPENGRVDNWQTTRWGDTPTGWQQGENQDLEVDGRSR